LNAVSSFSSPSYDVVDEDATFCAMQGISSEGFSWQSYNFPNR
jgi:hypothetical protein